MILVLTDKINNYMDPRGDVPWSVPRVSILNGDTLSIAKTPLGFVNNSLRGWSSRGKMKLSF